MSCLWGLLLVAAHVAGERHYPVPGGTYALESNYFISKDYVSNRMWQTYMRFSGQDTALLPDTTIYFKGSNYFTNPAYAPYPVVGLSATQMKGYCAWVEFTTDTLKRSTANTCATKYWKKIRTFDPADTLMMQVFIPDCWVQQNLKSHFAHLHLVTFCSDTLLQAQATRDFNKPVVAFRFAVRYVRRP